MTNPDKDLVSFDISTHPSFDEFTSILLPAPPSANELFGRNPFTRKMHRSRKYKDWQEGCGYVLVNRRAKNKIKRLSPDCTYGLSIVSNIARNRDLDNIAKPLIDLLVAFEITPDDRYLDTLSMFRCNAGGATPEITFPNSEGRFALVGWHETRIPNRATH